MSNPGDGTINPSQIYDNLNGPTFEDIAKRRRDEVITQRADSARRDRDKVRELKNKSENVGQKQGAPKTSSSSTTTHSASLVSKVNASPAIKSTATSSPAAKSTTISSPAIKSTTTSRPAIKSTTTSSPAIKSTTTSSPAVKSTTVSSSAIKSTTTSNPPIMSTTAPIAATPAGKSTTTSKSTSSVSHSTSGPSAATSVANSNKQCTVCKATFGRPSEKERHRKLQVVCPDCNTTICGQINYNSHRARNHPGTNATMKTVAEKHFKCPFDGCDKEYVRKDALQRHMRKPNVHPQP